MARFVVLLRAVNVGKRKAPMAELRQACAEAGFTAVESYIQSGNLVLSSNKRVPEIEAIVEALITERFGFGSEAVARTAAQWAEYATGSPFPEAEAARPSHLQLCLAKRPPKADVTERLVERATLGERVVLTAGVLWIDFAGGVGLSKLTPAILDKAAGSPVTARNWNTVQKLNEMAGR
jgi:uncharacterized protein (DUF1697 family)